MDMNELLSAISNMLEQTLEEKLEQKLEEKLDQKLEEKLDQKLEEKLDRKLEEKLDQKLDQKLEPIHKRLDSMDIRFDKVESGLSAVKAGQLTMQKKICEIDRTVNDTYQFALDAFGTSTENRQWLKKMQEA